MTVLAAALDALFSDPNVARDAHYRVQGADPPVPVRIVARRPDRIVDFGDTRFHSETGLFDVRVYEIESPRAGDTLELDGGIFIVQGEPVRDSERLVWTLDTRPA